VALSSVNLNFIIIEFHQINENIDAINTFYDSIKKHFAVAHLSFNNNSAHVDDILNTIEVTFVKRDTRLRKKVSYLPNSKLDFKNRIEAPSFYINY
jgi:archaellum component FlaC